MTARMVNGGKAVSPHLARDRVLRGRLSERTDAGVPDVGVNPRHLKTG